jgi:hypothetical protein
LKKAGRANNSAGRERSFATNYLAKKNKKLFGPQRTFDTGHTDLIEQSSLAGGHRLEPTKRTTQGHKAMSTKSELIAGLGIITVGGVLLLGLAKVPVGAKAAKVVKTMPLSYIEVEQTKQLIDAASKFYLDANTAVTATAPNGGPTS